LAQRDMIGSDSRRLSALTASLFVATTIVCAFQTSRLMLNYDVAGFLLDGEAILSGRRLFVDFFEIKTPSNACCRWSPPYCRAACP
jgi:hypothetical protein